jgi:hypothetical protein
MVNEKYIADVTVHEVSPSGWVNVIDKNKRPYALTQFGVKGIRGIKKGTKAKLYLRETENWSFYFLRPT